MKKSATTFAILVGLTPSTKNATRTGSNYQSLTLDQKRSVISARKKRGDNIAIAKELGYTPTYVSQVTTGVHENKTIVNRMYNKVRGRKAKASVTATA